MSLALTLGCVVLADDNGKPLNETDHDSQTRTVIVLHFEADDVAAFVT